METLSGKTKIKKQTNKQYEELNLTNVLYEWHMCGFRFIL